MLLQHNIGVSTEDEDTTDDEDDESYKYCVVMAENFYNKEIDDLDDEDNVDSKGKYIVTELWLYAYVRCIERPI